MERHINALLRSDTNKSMFSKRSKTEMSMATLTEGQMSTFGDDMSDEDSLASSQAADVRKKLEKDHVFIGLNKFF